MATQAIRVSPSTYDELRALAAERGTTMGTVVEDLLRARREKEFWDSFETGYAALRADPEAWAEERAERALWASTSMDRIADDPYDDPRITDEHSHG
jgi:hypothetical protein